MNYTAISAKKPSVKTAPKGDLSLQGDLKQKSMNAPVEDAEEEPEKGSAADKVWKKYKALAAGEAVDDSPDEQQAAPKTEKAAEETAPQPTGIAAIIQKYEANKQRQSQMRTIDVKRPTLPEKPSVETPEN